MEEKFAYVEKYLCGLQLSLVPNICCNHDIKLYIDLNNYFERGKHANEFQNKFNDPLYMPILSKLNVGDVTPGTQSWRFIGVNREEIAKKYTKDNGKAENSSLGRD